MSIDDPRLTAYALGELEPSEEAALEALLQADPAAAQEVAELRELATLVRSELTAEASPPLAEEQKREILAEAQRPAAGPVLHALPKSTPARIETMPVANWRRVWVPASIAACLAVAGGYGWLLQQRQHPFESSASATPPPRADVQISVEDEAVTGIPPAPSLVAQAPAPSLALRDAEEPRMELNSITSTTSTSSMDAITALPFQPGSSAASTGSRAKEAEHHAVALGAGSVSGPLGSDTRTAGKVLPQERVNQNQLLPAPATSAPMGRSDSSAGQAERLIAEAKGFSNLGRYDLARKRTNEALQIDPSNISARRLQEATEQKTSGSAIAGADQTRSFDLYKATRFWDRPVQRLAGVERSGSNLEAEQLLELRDERGLSEPTDRLTKSKSANTESYDVVQDNAFETVAGHPLSTFSIDVDTASYANVRRFLTDGTLPPKDAVRIEELVNYFPYQYLQPKGDDPFSVNMEVAACPWTPQHRLLRIGLKARELDSEKRPVSNLVFLIDVSGSMQPENKLPLVKKSLRLLVKQLAPHDTVGIVVYAGATGTVLEPTSDKKEILAALDHLEAGGSTNGGAGIRLAYDLAKQEFAKEKTNRVILATDGDFNVGTTSQEELTKLITEKARSGVFLSVLGFGYGNLKDNTMEKLADKGNGNYAYIDTMAEGRKVLVEQMAGTLFTVAKDVKMQIEFNPALVGSYRLLGYENRLLAKEDFNDDKKDAGEMGAGHTVTALYEIVPAGQETPGAIELTKVDAPRYTGNVRLKEAAKSAAETAPDSDPAAMENRSNAPKPASRSRTTGNTELLPMIAATAPAPAVTSEKPVAPDEMLSLKLRWKAPNGVKSTKREFPLVDRGQALEKSSADFRWAASVASFGMLLRDSPYKGEATWATTRELAEGAKGEKADTYRTEFLELLKKAQDLAE